MRTGRDASSSERLERRKFPMARRAGTLTLSRLEQRKMRDWSSEASWGERSSTGGWWPLVLGVMVGCVALGGGLIHGQEDPIRPRILNPRAPGQNADAKTKLEFSNLLYQYQRFDAAAVKYTEFLSAYPNHAERGTVWFRLADCYRRLGKDQEARQCYESYLKVAPDGEFAGPAALSVARGYFDADDYEEAIPYFDIARQELEDEDLRTETHFFYAQSLNLAGKAEEAIAAYEAFLRLNGERAYRDRAQLELARLLSAQDEKERAAELYEQLASRATDAAIKDEARFRSGTLLLELGEKEKALHLLGETLKDSENEAFRQVAQTVLLQQAYEARDWQDVLRVYGLMPIAVEGRDRAKIELMVGNAMRQLDELSDAIKVFGRIVRDFPGTPEASEAGYRQLLTFHEAGDDNLASFIDRYVARESEVDASTKYIDLALLLKGETLFVNEDFEGAAEAFQHVEPENVPEKYHAIRLYKMGWAMIDSGREEEGLEALGEFIAEYPNDANVASALMKRALTHSRQQDLNLALRDYQVLVASYPRDPNTEFAMHQIALIHRQQQALESMMEAYDILLNRFPKTKARAEALYWIGGGRFETENYADCLEPLEEARELDPESFGERASLRIIFARYHLEDIDVLLRETDSFVKNYGEPEVLLPVFELLGRELFDSKKYDQALPYLLRRSTPDEPRKTPPDIWKKLGRIHMRVGDWEKAIADLENLLLFEGNVQPRARAFLDQAICYLKLDKLEEGEAKAGEVLRLVRTGGLNAEARIILGDLAMARDEPAAAVQFYAVVAEFGTDPVMVPLALHQIINALEEQGKNDKVAVYRERLKRDFPDFDPGKVQLGRIED